MLRRFRVKNFYSIYDELEVSLLLTQRIENDYRSIATVDNKYANKLVALIGANGSGKTNILKTLSFIKWFVAHSFTEIPPKDPIPVEAHFLGADQASEFSLEFQFQGKVWRYDLILNEDRVIHESLHRYDYRFVYIFKRDWDEQQNIYNIKQKPEFDFSLKEARKVRKNASLISTAAQYNVGLALDLINLNIITNVTDMGRYSLNSGDQLLLAAEFFNSHPDFLSKMSSQLAEWDLGLTDVVIEEVSTKDKKGEQKTLLLPYGVHEVGDKRFDLLMFGESGGTRAAFVLLSKILPILDQGGLAVIDEIESDLHPHMLSALIGLFISPESNPHNAQLVFSTHSLEILNLLLKEQIVLVEKDENLNTDAYRLDDVDGVRVDDNFYAKYMAGAYGAIPEI